jgi:hypothetical protein
MQGGPGVSTFYSTDGVVDHAVLAGLFDGFKQYVPDAVTFEVENGGDTIDAETGDLIGAWGSGTSGPIVCTGATSYSAPVGLMIRWDTGAIMSGHRLRGKTYIVPALSTCFNLDGQVDATILADISSHAASYVSTASGACIWNRPRAATDKKPGHGGGNAAVSSGVVSPKAAIMRSRRD